MATDPAVTPASSVLAIAAAVLTDALRLAELGRWGAAEQTFDAALRLLEAARLLPHPAIRTDPAAPLLVWSADAAGWKPTNEVRVAVRGDLAVVRALLEMVDR